MLSVMLKGILNAKTNLCLHSWKPFNLNSSTWLVLAKVRSAGYGQRLILRLFTCGLKGEEAEDIKMPRFRQVHITFLSRGNQQSHAHKIVQHVHHDPQFDIKLVRLNELCLFLVYALRQILVKRTIVQSSKKYFLNRSRAL